jgi:hypothetical protein
VRERIADADDLARFMSDLHARLDAHPGRAPWSAHLDFLEGLLARYVRGASEIVDARRGLERFTALEQEVDFDRFRDVVRRAVETLRSEDVLQGRAGAFARRGVNVRSASRVNFARPAALVTDRRYICHHHHAHGRPPWMSTPQRPPSS